MRGRLLVVRDEALARRDAGLTMLGDARAARADSSDDEHDPEGPTVAFEWARAEALRRQAEADLEAVDRALRRVEAGTYGVCERCGLPIAGARLDARPTAELCVVCAAL